MRLPKNYFEAEVYSLNGKSIGNGILDVNSDTHCLFLFLADYTLQYTKDEVLGNFQLFNPADGLKYDLDRLLNG